MNRVLQKTSIVMGIRPATSPCKYITTTEEKIFRPDRAVKP
jgi:hypothetical protein